MCAPSNVAVLTLLCACVPSAPERYVTHPPTLAALRLRLPPGAIASYDLAVDRWLIASPTSRAILTPASAASVASPDAFRHAREVEVRGATVEVEARESLSDGFSTTLVEHAEADRAAPVRTTFVVRQLGNQWVQCVGSPSLCKSLKRG